MSKYVHVHTHDISKDGEQKDTLAPRTSKMEEEEGKFLLSPPLPNGYAYEYM